MDCNPYQLLLFWVRLVFSSPKQGENSGAAAAIGRKNFPLLGAPPFYFFIFILPSEVFSFIYIVQTHLCHATAAVPDVVSPGARQHTGNAPLCYHTGK